MEELVRKTHELEWTAISLCRRTCSLADRTGSREDRRHVPYLRARGYGNVLQRQRGRRGEGNTTPEGSDFVDRDIVLPDYESDQE